MVNSILQVISLDVILILGIIIYLLIKWSKQLETRRHTIFFYFLISTIISPIYSESSIDGKLEVWFPVGFVLIIIYSLLGNNIHSLKIRASLIGLLFGTYLFLFH